MKILWTVNLVPKDAAQGLGINSDVLGGWVESMASRLKKIDGVQLAVAVRLKSRTALMRLSTVFAISALAMTAKLPCRIWRTLAKA